VAVDLSEFDEAESDRKADSEAQRNLRRVVAERDELRRRLAVTGRMLERDLKPPKWMATRRKRSDHHATPTLLLTDTHFDEVVLPEQIDWLNAYNRPIAEMRLKKTIDTSIELAREYFTGLTYDGFLLLHGGDAFTGTIHQELRETNEAPLLKSIDHWENLLASCITRLADEFGAVHNAVTFGNHGRLSVKPVMKNRAWDNIEWLMFTHLAKYFAGDKRITWQIPDAADCHVQSYGTRYLLTHGDQFRGGSGIAGALSPLMLGAVRKSRRALAASAPYDTLVMGHWHQHLWLPSKGLIVGGTMKGYDEYAYLNNFDFEPANQAMWLTTPEHGITFPVQVIAQNRKEEGW
jgi:hypothetical protein